VEVHANNIVSYTISSHFYMDFGMARKESDLSPIK